jgi:hypothetical protein
LYFFSPFIGRRTIIYPVVKDLRLR